MKRLFTFLVLAGCIFFQLQAQWTQGFLFTPSLSLIEEVHFSGPSFGFAAATGNGGPPGYILKSTDGGANWAVNYPTTDGPVNDVHFPTGQTSVGYACGRYVYKTTNAGTSWDTTYTPFEDGGEIFFTSTTEGYMSGGVNSGILWKTTDGGFTWNTSPIPGFRPHQIQFLNTMVGYVAGGDMFSGGAGEIVKTTDAGASWQTLDYTPPLGGPTPGFDGMFWLDQNNGFLGSDNGILLKTTDGGQNWTQLTTSDVDSSGVTDIWFTSASVGFYSTISGEIFATNNGGGTWTLNATNQGGFAIYCLEFADANKGFGGGIIGTYLYTTNAGGSVSITPGAFTEMGLKIAPNPSDGNLRVSVADGLSAAVQLQLSDLSGRLILEETVPGWKLQDGYDLALRVPKGVYVMTLAADGVRKTARLVVQ